MALRGVTSPLLCADPAPCHGAASTPTSSSAVIQAGNANTIAQGLAAAWRIAKKEMNFEMEGYPRGQCFPAR